MLRLMEFGLLLVTLLVVLGLVLAGPPQPPPPEENPVGAQKPEDSKKSPRAG
jgi:hypothetical protein